MYSAERNSLTILIRFTGQEGPIHISSSFNQYQSTQLASMYHTSDLTCHITRFEVGIDKLFDKEHEIHHIVSVDLDMLTEVHRFSRYGLSFPAHIDIKFINRKLNFQKKSVTLA